MVSEDINKISLGSGNGSTGYAGTASKVAIAEIINVFEEFAKKRGVSVKSEDVQSIFNSHPDVFALPTDKQAEAIVNLLVGDDIVVETQTETYEQEQVNASESFGNIFGSFTADDAEILKQEINASLSESEFAKPAKSAVEHKHSENGRILENNATAVKSSGDTKMCASINATMLQVKERLKKEEVENKKTLFGVPSSTTKTSNVEVYSECLLEYAKNLYMHGEEKHSEEEWNNLTEEQRFQFIQDKNVSKFVNEHLSNAQSAAALYVKDKDSISKDFLLENHLLLLQAANSREVSVEEFQQMSKMRQAAAIMDVIDQKNKADISLNPVEAIALENAELLKKAMIHTYSEEMKKDPLFKDIDTISKMSYSELYSIIDGTHYAENMMLILKNYLKAKADKSEEMTPREKATWEVVKKVPDTFLTGFGVEPVGESYLDTTLMADEKAAAQYKKIKDHVEQAKFKADYFYKTYGDDPEKYMAALEDAKKHGNVLEMSALLRLLDKEEAAQLRNAIVQNNPDLAGYLTLIDANTRSKLDQNEVKNSVVYGLRRAGAQVETGVIAAAQVQDSTKILVSNVSELSVPLSNEMKDLHVAVANGILDGSAEAVRNGDLGKEEFGQVGTNAAKCCEEVQDHAVDIAGDKTIPTEARATFTTCLVKDSGYAASRCVDKHVVATFGDNPDAQKAVFGAVQTSIETHLPKEQAVKVLNKLADQVPEMVSSVQADVHRMLTNGKYEEVAIHAASNIHTYDESAQAEALKISYESGNNKIIEAATLQVEKMAEVAVKAMKAEITQQVAKMEESHSLSAIEEYAIRQLKKELGFDVDITTPQFKSKLEAYIAELKGLSRIDLYTRICADIQSWPTDKQAMIVDAIARYCPELFVMLLEKFGVKLLSSFGQLNSMTRNAILIKMLNTPSMRSEAMAYMRANSSASYSDELKELYNNTYDMLVKTGAIIEEETVSDNLRDKSYQSVPQDFNSYVSLSEIGYKYNWNMKQDINGNIGLVS